MRLVGGDNTRIILCNARALTILETQKQATSGDELITWELQLLVLYPLRYIQEHFVVLNRAVCDVGWYSKNA